jgi:hypothetical protein
MSHSEHPRHVFLFLFLVLPLVLSMRCDRPLVGINPDPEDPGWREADNPKTLAAKVSNLDESEFEILEVFVTWSRLPFDPRNETNVHRVSATREAPGSKRWIATFPATEQLPDTQEINYNWHLNYRNRQTNALQSIISFVRTFQIGCSGNNWEKVLLADQQTVVATFGGLTTPEQIAGAGYVPSHGYKCFKGMGVAFVLPDVRTLTGGHSPQLGRPDLLFFSPNPGASEEDAKEPLFPDPPYTLIGWAYAFEFNPAVHPRWQCMPFDSWFVHEAGWHLPNGGFIPTPPSESTPGSQVATPPLGQLPPIGGVWHPRLWDLHIWRNGNQVPALDIFSHTGEPAVGDGFPAGSFFRLPLSP